MLGKTLKQAKDLVLSGLKDNSYVQINGSTYRGNNITLSNGKIIVDGVVQEDVKLGYDITVNIHGDVGHVENANGNVTANNVVKSVSTVNGEVNCDNVGGDVSTVNGDIECSHVEGKVSTVNGDITKG